MGLLNILPLIFMVARAFAARVPLCVLPPNQAGLPAESTDNCLCSVESSTIINSLDPYNAGVERLVIYIYRKLDTGETITFIPHKQLQHRIPDFPEEYGTVNINDHQSIAEIFNNSPSKEIREHGPESVFPGHNYNYAPHPGRKRNNKQVKPVATVVKKRLNLHGQPDRPYKNVKHPSWLIPVIKPHPEYVTDSNDYRPTDYPQDHIKHYKYRPHHSDSDNYLNYVTPKDPYHGNFHDTPTNSDISHDGQNSDEDYLENPASGENEANRDMNDTLESSHPRVQVIPLRPNDGSHISDDHLQPDENNWGPISGSNKPPNAKIIRVPRKDNSGRVIGWQTIKTYWAEKAHHNSAIPDINNGNLYYPPINDYRDWNVPRKVPFWPGSHLNSARHRVIKLNPYHKDTGNHEPVPSFDYWLNHQLNITTTNGNKLPNEDIIALHTAIRNTLLQNGLIVTKRGTLVDGHGMVSSLDNLKLRPIIMGRSISFNRFIRNVHSDINFTIPPNSPFLEGLLLTMINPPKILGIVPVSRSSVSHKLHHTNDGEGPINGHGRHKVGKSSSLKVLPINHVVSFRKDKSNHQKLTKAEPIHSFTKISNSDQFERSDPKQGLKEEVQPTEGFSEEVPDFRIIGGTSATISGTPLLNRGRSGREFEYPVVPAPFNPIKEQFSSRFGRIIDEDDEETR